MNGARAGGDDLEVALPHVVEAHEGWGEDGDAPARPSLFEFAAMGFSLHILADIPRATMQRDLPPL
jgi:hypothetical protein